MTELCPGLIGQSVITDVVVPQVSLTESLWSYGVFVIEHIVTLSHKNADIAF